MFGDQLPVCLTGSRPAAPISDSDAQSGGATGSEPTRPTAGTWSLYFEIGDQSLEACAELDVALPIVPIRERIIYANGQRFIQTARNEFLPEYPRCPDYGGRLPWAEAGRDPAIDSHPAGTGVRGPRQ